MWQARDHVGEETTSWNSYELKQRLRDVAALLEQQ
jgi:hypothetical protein